MPTSNGTRTTFDVVPPSGAEDWSVTWWTALAAGANPDAGFAPPDAALRAVSTDRDTYALWEAITQDSAEMVEALLQAGARVEGPATGGMSPVHGALLQRKIGIIRLLLAYGADPDARWNGRTAREVAGALGIPLPE